MFIRVTENPDVTNCVQLCPQGFYGNLCTILPVTDTIHIKLVPPPAPNLMSPKRLSQNYATNTNIQHSEDPLHDPTPSAKPIRLTSERVLSPREVTNSENYA